MEKFEIMRTEERNRYTLKRMREEALRRHRINMLRRRKHGRTVQGYVPRRRLRPGPRYRQSQNLPKLQQSSRLELNSADADEDDFYQSDEVISRSGHQRNFAQKTTWSAWMANQSPRLFFGRFSATISNN